MADNQRRSERYRVALKVRYSTARDFVIEYAENLSEGGLFVRGAQRLDKGDAVTVELELPGFETFQVGAVVAHTLSAEDAAERSRRPGAGLRITEGPDGFEEALHAYLMRLGRRRDNIILVENPQFGALLSEAGYHVRKAPPPDGLHAAISEADMDVLAVVVPRSRQGEYGESAMSMGAPEVVRAVDFEEELDSLLADLDEELTPFE
jgi:uncharacterized protein (TIGR02266 family)